MHGFGVIKAAVGVSKHINLAAKSNYASKNVRAHAIHVASSSENTVIQANEIVVAGKKVLAAGNAGDAARHVKKMATLTQTLVKNAVDGYSLPKRTATWGISVQTFWE